MPGSGLRAALPVRAGRLTNLALVALVTLALATGTASYALGAPPGSAVVTTAHAAAGLALVLLVPWKRAVARRGLTRPTHPGRGAGVWLAALLLLTVAAGVWQQVGGFATAFGLSPLTLHVASALLAVPLLVTHLVTHPQRLRAADLSRRTALRAVLIGAGGLAAVAASRLLSRGSGRQRSTGSTELGSFQPAGMPVTQWFSDTVPAPARRHRALLVDGRPVDLAGSLDEVEAVLDCTGGWYATQRWHGVRLDRLLPPSAARSIEVVSATGYRRRFPAGDAPRLLLATSMAGQPLSPGHGGPRRLVAPGRRGFWWVKWVVAIELIDEPPWQQPPFPPQ